MSVDQYAVIGNPVSHSLSPEIHSEFGRQTNQDLQYVRIEAPYDGFESAARNFMCQGGCGLSVTAPFKGDACRWVHEIDEYAAESGAVNCISMNGNTIKGFNTDGIGLLRDFSRMNWKTKGLRVLVLGAGGAARGIVGPILRDGGFVTVANRTVQKLAGIESLFPNISTMPMADVRSDWDIVINATSAHLQSAELPVDPQAFKGARCYDLAYSRNGTTPFTALTRQCDAKEVHDGLGMLVFQAACAFKVWRGIDPDAVSVLEHLRGQ